ncbi:hypothetical protein [Mycolicibacterium lutetiense]
MGVEPYSAWQSEFRGRTEIEETALFKTQARSVYLEWIAELASEDSEPLDAVELGIRKRLVATAFQDLFDVQKRAAEGSVRGSGVRGDKASEWCFPLGGNDDQLGELRHPVLEEDDEGSTDVLGWQIRMYFAAPSIEPALILYLVFGRKPSSRVSSQWRAIQRDHIETARGEFITWHANRQFGNSLPPAGS